jgi:hypothetical protein
MARAKNQQDEKTDTRRGGGVLVRESETERDEGIVPTLRCKDSNVNYNSITIFNTL